MPSVDDWRQLWKISSHSDVIVDDAMSVALAPRARIDRGLLDFGQDEQMPSIEPRSAATESRLRSGLDVFGRRDLWLESIREDLEAILPGISDIGQNRQQRLDVLHQKLGHLKAYLWLLSSAHYISACKSLQTIKKRGAKAYQGDMAMLKLLSVTSFWMMLWTEKGKCNYPTRDELKRAHQNAKQLLRFVHASKGLTLRGRLSHFDGADLTRLISELAVLERSYKRPKPSDPISEADYAHVLIRLLAAEFGNASPSLVEHLLGLIGYIVDKDRVNTLIRSQPPPVAE